MLCRCNKNKQYLLLMKIIIHGIIPMATIFLMVKERKGGSYMITIAVCDDDRNVTEKIKRQITAIIMQEKYLDVDINIHATQDSHDLLSFARTNSIDVLFLDIMMPGCDGIHVAEEFFEVFPQTLIIFTSGYENMVFFTMKFRPFRFVRKSHLYDDLIEATESALDSIISLGKRIVLKSKGESYVVIVSKIKYVENQGNYLFFHYEEAEYKVRSRLSEYENMLKYHGIIRINSGTLVNVRFISCITRNSVTVRNGPTLPVSNKYQKEIESSFMNYVRRQII